MESSPPSWDALRASLRRLSADGRKRAVRARALAWSFARLGCPSEAGRSLVASVELEREADRAVELLRTIVGALD